MKKNLSALFVLILLLSSCGGVKKTAVPEDAQPALVPAVPAPSVENATDDSIPEVEEKLVALNEIPPDPSRYFVIIGSFRSPENAARYQEMIRDDGFQSTLLQNEEGLIRVSVLATDDISEARAEIHRIRSAFPEYFDTWLLVQKR
ncbi:MAG: SPOR domain-containing protein [Bacteroidales bacterium]